MAADRFSVPCTWIDEAKKNGIGYATLRSRLMYGWTPEDAMNTPLRKRRGKRVEKPKLKYSIEEIKRIARENGESYGVTVARLDGYLEGAKKVEKREAVKVLRKHMATNENMIDESDFGKYVGRQQEALKVAVASIERLIEEEMRDIEVRR